MGPRLRSFSRLIYKLLRLGELVSRPHSTSGELGAQCEAEPCVPSFAITYRPGQNETMGRDVFRVGREDAN